MTYTVTFGRKSAPQERRRQRERHFEMMLEDYREFQETGTWHLMSGFVFDEEHQLFRTPDGRPVMSRHFVDADLLFGEDKVPPGYY